MSASMEKSGSPMDVQASERLKADMRQFSGVMFGLAICVTFQPLAGIATRIGPDGTTASSGLPLAGLISGCILAFIGTVGMYTGFLGAVMDKYIKNLTLFLVAVIQLAWMPFLTDLTAVGKNTKAGCCFVDIEGATEKDNRFVGAMGMLGILTYASSFVGSFAFMAFCLHAYQTGKASERAAGYFAGRLVFYSSLVFLAGLSQLLLGSYVVSRFGGGPVSGIGVAMYIVHWPEINIFIGVVQLLIGIWGICRRFGILIGGECDHSFQHALFFNWICQLSMQVLTQVGYAPGGELAPAAPTIACLSLGLSVAPAFLDYKMRNLPDEFPADYYGSDNEAVAKDKMDTVEDKMEPVEDKMEPVEVDDEKEQAAVDDAEENV